MGGLGAGGVQPRADALSILEVRAASLGVIYSIPLLFHIKLAPNLVLILYLFVPCLPCQAVAVKPLGLGITTRAGQGRAVKDAKCSLCLSLCLFTKAGTCCCSQNPGIWHNFSCF